MALPLIVSELLPEFLVLAAGSISTNETVPFLDFSFSPALSLSLLVYQRFHSLTSVSSWVHHSSPSSVEIPSVVPLFLDPVLLSPLFHPSVVLFFFFLNGDHDSTTDGVPGLFPVFWLHLKWNCSCGGISHPRLHL